MELIKDYDCVIDYHPKKANVVADALSRKSVQTLRVLNVHLSLSDDGEIVAKLIVKSDLLNRVLEAQKNDEKIFAIVNQSRKGKETEFTVNEDGFVYYKDWVCVPNDDELKKSILEEAHSGSFAMHPGSTKMYQDLKTSYYLVRNEKRCIGICDQVYGVSKSEGKTSSSFRIVTAYQDTRMEMGPNHNGFCGRVIVDRKKA